MVDLKDAHPGLNDALVELVAAKTEYNKALANSGNTAKLAGVKKASDNVINILGLDKLAGKGLFINAEFLENDRSLEINNGIGVIKHYSDTVKISFVPGGNAHRESIHFPVKREGGDISFDGEQVLREIKNLKKRNSAYVSEKLESLAKRLEEKLNPAISTSVTDMTSFAKNGRLWTSVDSAKGKRR